MRRFDVQKTSIMILGNGLKMGIRNREKRSNRSGVALTDSYLHLQTAQPVLRTI